MTDGFALPEGFRFGVATAGFQVEGHFNGPGEPCNNWFTWEEAGRVEPSGIAVDFWERYPDHLDRAVAAGCDSFRLSVEWARCQPTEGLWDDTAFDRVPRHPRACHERGLEPLVTLHHFTHPYWLGDEFWLRLDAPERFAAWVARAVREIGPLVTNWVTLNEINVYALQTFLIGLFPPGRRMAMGKTVRSLDHLLTAHVLAYAEIHAQQPGATVATNPFAFSVYEIDRLLSDVLLARLHGVDQRGSAPLAGSAASGIPRHDRRRIQTGGRVPLGGQNVDSSRAGVPACRGCRVRERASMHARRHPTRLLQPGRQQSPPSARPSDGGRAQLVSWPAALGRSAEPRRLSVVRTTEHRARTAAVDRRERA